jgi:hypothetical protein
LFGYARGPVPQSEIKGSHPADQPQRDLFGSSWSDVDRNGCDTSNDVLQRELTGEKLKPGHAQLRGPHRHPLARAHPPSSLLRGLGTPSSSRRRQRR